MNIIVCIKQVPDTESLGSVRINGETNTLIREGIPSIINPFDENAIEEALRLKEKHGGKVTVITMGPPQAEEALRKALAMGADEAILLSDPALIGSDTLATSYALSTAIKKIGQFDLILFGKQAIDGDTAQVGPGVAERLGLPQITYVRKLEIENSKVKAQRTLEDAFEVVETKLPAVFMVTKEMNEPRYSSMRGVLRAKKAQIPVWKATDLDLDKERIGLDGSPTQVIKIFTPEPPGKGELLEGTVPEQVEALVSKLREAKVI
ncbi:electron transfer flavoprotein subunit beta/FixA family protein [bacterium]|nr:electron transfer flavoprotein subunit beta/FixA family protein [bacterium]MCK4436746.1 electron transfer flavoprotein subunit beta/FixA family protein [bacterium]